MVVKNKKQKVCILLIVLLVLILPLYKESWAVKAKEKYEDLQVFAKVLNLVQQYYVENVDAQKIIYGGIKGMLNELDPHTNFLPPDIFKEFENETSGEFGGLGVEMSVQNGILTVLSPIEDTPAWKAGIKSGDKIVTINGESTKGFSLAEAAQRMKGKRGEAVRLGVFREGFEEPKEYIVIRDVIKIKSVKYTDLEDGYALIRITSFMERTATELEAAIKKHTKKHKQTKGLLIDLRNNPGGLLNQAVKISDMFLEEGTIVTTIGRDKNKPEVVTANKDGTFPRFPIVVVINEYSASASEILAGALQDHSRALIVGEKSFGKGSVQSVVKLGDGSGLKLTVARYYTPSGVSIQSEGIKPDVNIPNVDAEVFQKAIIQKQTRREKDIKGHLLGDKEQNRKKKENKNSNGTKFWFLDASSGEEKKADDMGGIFKKDFQLLQGYNYLRSLSLIQKSKLSAKSTTN